MVHDLEQNPFVAAVERMQAEKRSFFLSPDRWRSSRVKRSLSWTEVKFLEKNKNEIPEVAGIYCFVVKHVNNHFPPHGYVMYIGITGHKSTRGLRNRFSDYIREKNKNKRPKLHFMLNKFSDDLYFYYVELKDHKDELEQLEIDLNDAIIPPFGQNDFSAEIRQLRGALDG